MKLLKQHAKSKFFLPKGKGTINLATATEGELKKVYDLAPKLFEKPEVKK